MDSDHRLATAYHQAGHAVVGRILRLPCGGAALAQGRTADVGHAVIVDPWLAANNWWEVLEKQRPIEAAFRATIIALMAGREAELAILGYEFYDRQAERRDIERMGLYLHRNGGWGRYRSRLNRRAHGLVRRHRPKIERVAKVLNVKGMLTADEIDVLVMGAPFPLAAVAAARM